MKDLKHLIYFENLLQEANNDLVQQARKDGKKAIAYTCYHIPEVLLNLDNCFSVRLRAPRTGSMDIATYYLSSYLCGYSKALLERAIEGGYNFLSALFALTFTIYFFNLDMKLIRIVYDKMGKHYDNLDKKDKKL